jgi:hypothetical protein
LYVGRCRNIRIFFGDQGQDHRTVENTPQALKKRQYFKLKSQDEATQLPDDLVPVGGREARGGDAGAHQQTGSVRVIRSSERLVYALTKYLSVQKRFGAAYLRVSLSALFFFFRCKHQR